MLKISACTITKNEEENIGRWLDSVSVFADEIIVVDTGSSDRTVAIAEERGASVYHFDWINDFAAAKNYALDQATGDWIVFPDTDETFSPECVGRVRRIIENNHDRDDLAGFMVYIVNVDIDTGNAMGTHSYAQRIFRRKSWIRFQGAIHEFVNNLTGNLNQKMELAQGLELLHTGYSPRIIKQKLERNLRLILERQEREGEHILDNYHLMDCYYGLDDYKKALECATSVILAKLNPVGSESRAYIIRLRMLIKLDCDETEIDSAYNEAVAEHPKDRAIHFTYANYLWNKSHFSKAGKIISLGLKLFEEYGEQGNYGEQYAPLNYYRMAQLAIIKQDWDTALNNVIKSLTLDKQSHKAIKLLASILTRLGKNDSELVEFIGRLQLYKEEDSILLAQALQETNYGIASLYYNKRAEKKLSMRQQYRFTNKVEAATSSLVEELTFDYAFLLANIYKLPNTKLNTVLILMPKVYRGISVDKNSRGVRRKITRIQNYCEAKAIMRRGDNNG